MRWGEHSLSTTGNQGEVFQRVESGIIAYRCCNFVFVYVRLKENQKRWGQ